MMLIRKHKQTKQNKNNQIEKEKFYEFMLVHYGQHKRMLRSKKIHETVFFY